MTKYKIEYSGIEVEREGETMDAVIDAYALETEEEWHEAGGEESDNDVVCLFEPRKVLHDMVGDTWGELWARYKCQDGTIVHVERIDV